jgi:uncharacterized protein (DUF2249 family)
MSLKERILVGLVRGMVRVRFAIGSRYRARFSDYPDDPEWPWLTEYAALGIPETVEPYPDVPLHRFLYDAAEESPENGLIQRGATVTYPEVLEHAERLATALAERGIGQGDRVATILPTSVQFAVVDSAISIAAGVHVPNDFLDATEDLEYRLEQSGADLLVGHDAHEELVFELAERVGIDDVILTTLQEVRLDGVVFVTTPFHAAVSDTGRSLELFRDEDVPVLGLAVNMAGFTCPTCGDDHDLFEHGDPTGDLDAPVLADLSFDPAMQGTPAPTDLPDQAERLGTAVADRMDEVWGLDLPDSAVDLRGVPPEDRADRVESGFRAVDLGDRFVVASDRDPSPVRRFLASISPAVDDPEDLTPFEVEQATPETWVAETVRPEK